jgi:flagellar biogenesis protein FliO
MEVDLYHYLYSFLGLILTLGLVLLTAYALKRLGFSGTMLLNKSGNRLKIVEINRIDNNHKLVLFTKDNNEHLILIGTNAALLIESEKFKKPTKESHK